MPLATNAYAAAVSRQRPECPVLNRRAGASAQGPRDRHLPPGQAGITNYTPAPVIGPTDAGNTYGFGSMIHRMVTGVFAGMNPQAARSPSTSAPTRRQYLGSRRRLGTFAITGPATAAGTAMFYIDNIAYQVTVTDLHDRHRRRRRARRSPWPPIPTPLRRVNTTGSVACTAKSKGIWGNYIPYAMNLGATDRAPRRPRGTPSRPLRGAGTNSVSIAAALTALGANDGANILGITDVVHGYHQDQAVITAIGTYGGLGNTSSGLYGATVHRPFRCLTGDVVAGSHGLHEIFRASRPRTPRTARTASSGLPDP